jgi:phage tail-like protein
MTSRPLNSDPLRNFRFLVTINHPQILGLTRMGFMAMSGLSVNNEVIPYREGGNNTTTRKMPGQSDFGPITLTRGFMAAPVSPGGGAVTQYGTNEIFQWFSQIFAVNIGSGSGAGYGTPPTNNNFRVGLNIDVLGYPVTSGPNAAGIDSPPFIKARFFVYNAWPMGYSFSDLEAGGNAVFIENLQLAHEGWAVQTATQDPASYVPYTLQQPTLPL